MIKFCCSFTAVIIGPLSNFYSDSRNLIIYFSFSPTQSKRKWHFITKQRELQCDCNSPLRRDPWMSVWEPPTTGGIMRWAALFIWHERRTRVWVTGVNECRKNKSRRSNAIRGNWWVSEWVSEWGKGVFLWRFPARRRPSSAGSFPRNPGLHLFKAKDDLLALTRKEVTSDRLTQPIALQLRTCLDPAAACFSAACIPPDLGSCYKIWHWRSAGFLFLGPSDLISRRCRVLFWGLFFQLHIFRGVGIQGSFENT